MLAFTETLQWVALIPVVVGSGYALISTVAVLRFFGALGPNQAPSPAPSSFHPPVSMLKPVCGMEKGLETNLRSACLQEYPHYQVVFSVQDGNDPALPVLYALEEEFGPDLVSVVVGDFELGANGKVNNLAGALTAARHDVIVVSDSDTRLDPAYLSRIVAPLSDPDIGLVCTPFKLIAAERWYEKMALLSINADFMPSVVFAALTGASGVSLGPSTAFRRSTLERIGGLESLADYLVEDYEMGRRIWSAGWRTVLVPHTIDAVVDLSSPKQWWTHQIYWDQNTRAARPRAFFATVLMRSVPFALLFALLRGFDTAGLVVLALAVAVRLISAAISAKWGFRDAEGLGALALLPLRDVVGLAVWVLSFTKRIVVWRDVEFELERDGRMTRRHACTYRGTELSSPTAKPHNES